MTDTDTQLADRYADELDRLPDDRREEFLVLLARTNRSGKVLAAALDYDAGGAPYTQEDAAAKWGVASYTSVGEAWRAYVRGDGDE